MFFQVKKFSYLHCLDYKPLRGDSPIDVFPDPMPAEVDVVLHYKLGSDPEKTSLSSILLKNTLLKIIVQEKIFIFRARLSYHTYLQSIILRYVAIMESGVRP